MKHYVLGLIFNKSSENILLIEKLRPEWQKFRWNGIGGKIEEGETPNDAIHREANEEVGRSYVFEHVITFTCPGGTVYVYKSIFPEEDIPFKQIEDENLSIWSLDDLPISMMGNLRWLIPLSLAAVAFPIYVHQKTLGV